MREHPEYKYRPRRKPKPLVKKDGSSKYGFPLPFFPPGMDPIMAARSFAFSPHYAAALAAATAFGAHSNPANNILSANDLINPFSTLPVPANPVHPTMSPTNTTSRILAESDPSNILKNKSIATTESTNVLNLYSRNIPLNSQEGFLEFVQKYQLEQNGRLSSPQKVPSNLIPSPSKINDIPPSNMEIQIKTNDEQGERDENDGDDDESMDDDSDTEEFLDVDGNGAGQQSDSAISDAEKDCKKLSGVEKINAEKESSLEYPRKCSQRSPSCPDSTTSPSPITEPKPTAKLSAVTAESNPESNKKSPEFSPNDSKNEINRPFEQSPKTTYPDEAKLRIPNYLNISAGHHLNEKHLYTNSSTTSSQLFNGNIPSMTAHTNPVAFHLLSSYIAAGLVPQIPGSASLIPFKHLMTL